MPVDLEKYRHYLDGFDMTEKQKDEYLETVWQIVGSFVDAAWGVHPVQLAMEAREKDRRDSPDRKRRRGRSRKG